MIDLLGCPGDGALTSITPGSVEVSAVCGCRSRRVSEPGRGSPATLLGRAGALYPIRLEAGRGGLRGCGVLRQLGPLELRPVPPARIGGRLVTALQEFEQRLVRRRRLPDVFIGEDQLAEVRIVHRAAGNDPRRAKPL